MGGPGRGCYAGQPIAFYCVKCRRTDEFRRWVDRRLSKTPRAGGPKNPPGKRWVLTGKTKPITKSNRPGMDWRKRADKIYQYRCLTCGHVGWSSHPDVPLYAVSETESSPV